MFVRAFFFFFAGLFGSVCVYVCMLVCMCSDGELWCGHRHFRMSRNGQLCRGCFSIPNFNFRTSSRCNHLSKFEAKEGQKERVKFNSVALHPFSNFYWLIRKSKVVPGEHWDGNGQPQHVENDQKGQ